MKSYNPTKALMASYLLQQIGDLHRYHKEFPPKNSGSLAILKWMEKETEFHDDLNEWFNSDSMAPFSYLFCCEILDIDPEKGRTEFKDPECIARAKALLAATSTEETSETGGLDEYASHVPLDIGML